MRRAWNRIDIEEDIEEENGFQFETLQNQ